MTRHFLSVCSAMLIALVAACPAVAQDESLIAPGEKVQKLASGMKFTEGPVWIPAKKLLVFSDIPNSKLMQWSEKGGLSVFRESEQSNGNILDLEGRLITCQHAASNIVRTEADGKITVLIDKFEGKRLNSPNDVAVRSDGTLWFTDPTWGLNGRTSELPGCWVYKFDPATGKVEPVVKDLSMPNGINFSPDESRIYIADTGGNKLSPDATTHTLKPGIHCYEVSKDGQLGKKLFTIDHGSDGMCLDVKGNLYTTNGKILVHDPDGKLIETIDVPEGPANCTFGGDDYKTLFITARTSLYSVKLKNAGAKPVGAKW
jgi:gluconolactonase